MPFWKQALITIVLLRKLQCVLGGGGSHSSASMHLNVGLSERYTYFSQSDRAKCVRSNPIPGKLQAQRL